MTECKYCHTPITWTKRASKNIPLNIDGTDHHCKDGVNIPSTEKLPTQIGKLIMYAGNQAVLLLKDGKEHSYAITADVLKNWQTAGHLLPAENHPDVWLEFSVDDKGFIRQGAKAVQRPGWAQDLSDPTKGEIKSPFRTGTEVKQERAIEAPGSSSTTNPPTSTGTAPQTTGAPAQGQSTADPSVKELFTDLANTDQRVFEAIKHHEPELWDAFVRKIASIGEDPTRQKGPVERGEFPTPDELLAMVYNYDTYWKSKTILDLMAAKRIADQVEFKNRLECVSLALSTKPADRETCYRQAWDIYDTITQKINGVTKDEKR